MDGENHGKPYEQMDDLRGKTPLFLGNPDIQGYVSFRAGIKGVMGQTIALTNWGDTRVLSPHF